MAAPYDQRNEADYKEYTLRIEAALEKIRKDPSIPATQESLTKLAGCSRGTLHHRKTPIEDLKQIKRNRVEQKSNPKPARISRAHRLNVESHLADKASLKDHLDMSRSEIAIWAEKHFILEENEKRLNRKIQHLINGRERAMKLVEKMKTLAHSPEIAKIIEELRKTLINT